MQRAEGCGLIERASGRGESSDVRRAWERPTLIRLDVDRQTYGGASPNIYETGHVVATTHTVFSFNLYPSHTITPTPGGLS